MNTVPRRSPRLEIAFDLLLTHVWRIDDDRLRRRLCNVLMRDRGEVAVTWRFHVNRLWAQNREEQFRLLTNGIFRPDAIVLWLENSVRAGRLSRSDANAAQEAIFPWIGADGQWR